MLVEFPGEDCEEVRVLEHVQVVASIEHTRRGALTLTLTSPQGNAHIDWCCTHPFPIIIFIIFLVPSFSSLILIFFLYLVLTHFLH